MGDHSENRDIYECIFYAKKLGLNFKFQNQKAFVVSYDEEESNASYSLQESKTTPPKDESVSNKIEQWNVYKEQVQDSKIVEYKVQQQSISISKPNSMPTVPTATMVIPGLSSPSAKPTATSVVVVGAEVSIFHRYFRYYFAKLKCF